jgi:phage-related protein
MGQLPATLHRMISETRQVSDEEAQKRRETMAEEFENTIGNFRESVSVIMESLNQSEGRQIEREQSLLDQMNHALQKTVAQVQDMTEIQESSRNSLSKLMAETRHTIEAEQSLLGQINENTAAMLRITGAFEQIAKTTEKSSAQISSTSESFQDIGKLFRDDFEKLSQLNHETFGQFKKALSQNQELLEEHAQKFQTIQKGLSRIFGEIDEGLRTYSQTAKQGINDYLSEFSKQLSEAAGRLAGSIEALNELFEMVSDLLEKAGK